MPQIRSFRRPLNPDGPPTWRRRKDGKMNVGELLELLASENAAPQPQVPVPQGNPRPQIAPASTKKETGQPPQPSPWKRHTNRHASRGSRLRPVPRAGRVKVADAVGMLGALGSRRAVRRAEKGGWWNRRAQAVLAVAAGLAVMGGVERVLGHERRRWWARLCALPTSSVMSLKLPPVAERAMRRWLKVRVYSAMPWVALPGSPMRGADSRERLGMCAAREAQRIGGRAVRPAALLRWCGPCPAQFRRQDDQSITAPTEVPLAD